MIIEISKQDNDNYNIIVFAGNQKQVKSEYYNFTPHNMLRIVRNEFGLVDDYDIRCR